MHRSRLLPLLLLPLCLSPFVHGAGASAASPEGAQEPAADGADAAVEPVIPTAWLVLASVDRRGRRPFRPDAVLREHVLPGTPPVAGGALSGERGEETWEAVEANEKGRVRREGGSIGYAYARVEVAERTVRMAKLTGASTLVVNGAATAGDIYSYGWGGLPVVLEAGANDVYVSGIRGSFALVFDPVETVLQPGRFSFTKPDFVVGESPSAELGICVRNAGTEWLESVSITVGGVPLDGDQAQDDVGSDVPLLRSTYVFEEGLAPLSVRNLAVRVSAVEPDRTYARAGKVGVEITVHAPGQEAVRETLTLHVREPRARRSRTYRSNVDGSVQLLSVLPPSEPTPEDGEVGPMRLALTLHGAGVHAPSQAGSYSQKPDFWIVAPTNRSKFGFDWQDWGRIDAYDALAVALRESGVDRSRVSLTGHSMGGHGTWHLGANDPDGFAAIAPSAGWQSFDTYGGRPDGALRDLWHRADAPSRTVDLVDNLVQTPTFILHGDADDNVPAKEARDMLAMVTEAGGAPLSHFEPGKGHWWNGPAAGGADCVDWPGIFELFRASEIPTNPREIDFTTVDPGTDARHHWVEVLQAIEPGRPARVVGSLVGDDSASVSTENVRALRLFGVDHAMIDSFQVAFEPGAWLVRGEGGTWSAVEPREAAEKHPGRMGPLKRGFDRRFVLVVPTGGSDAENAASLDRARFDASTWWYRGNGDAPIVRDETWLARSARYADRNVVLYGNADTNRAWGEVLDRDVPIAVRRGEVTYQVGGEASGENGRQGARVPGDSTDALFVYPRRASSAGLVVALGSSGVAADRRASTLALFVSGVGYPDYAIVGPGVLAEGDGGVVAAGFFDAAWR